MPIKPNFLTVNLLLILSIVVLVVHLPTLSVRATSFDDQQYLTRNVLVQNPSWDSAGRFLTEVLEPSTVTGYYQPLAMISLMLDRAAAGRPDTLFAFHRTSLFLHVANTVVVTVLLYLLFGRLYIAAAVGLLFGLHPMTVEPVAWISERKTLLAAFFSLSSLIFYVRFARSRDWKCYLGCSAMYVLALMSKPSSIPLPLLMMLMDYWPLRRLKWQAVREKMSLFALGGIFAAITLISQGRTGTVELPTQYDLWRIPLILCHNIIFYLYKILWPVGLASHYAFPKPVGLADTMVFTGLIGTCALIPLLVLSLRWTRAALTGWLIFFLALLPATGVIRFTNTIAADRHVYLPSIGLLMVLTALLSWLYPATSAITPSVKRVAITIIVLVLAGAEALGTRLYLGHWRDSVSLYQHMLTVSPDAAPVHNNLAIALQAHGKFEEAEHHYRKALRINPHHAFALNNLGNALLAQDKLAEAIRHYQKAIATKRDYANAHSNLGVALAKGGWSDLALAQFRKAVRLNPNAPNFLTRLAWFLATHPDPNIRNGSTAIRLAERASQLTGNQALEAIDTLAAAYASTGQFNRAVATAQEALRLASATGRQKITSRIRKRLELYRHGRPYREDPTQPEPESAVHHPQDQSKSGGRQNSLIRLSAA